MWPGWIALPLLALALGGCAEESTSVKEDTKLEPVLAEASVDRAVATTGDVITFRVKVDYAEQYEIRMVEPGSEIAGFRIIDLGREETRRREGRVIEERWYQLRADLVGSYILPPVRVEYRERPNEKVGAQIEGQATAVESAFAPVETSAIFVEVESVLPSDGEAEDIRGLKAIRQVQDSKRLWWIIGATILIVGALTWIYLQRRRRKQVALPPRPPHELAFEALRALREIDLENPQQVRRFYFGISEAIRAYIEGRFRLNATDLTTEEILPHLSELDDLAANNRERLEFFLVDTDQVKFADYLPSGSEIESTYESALTFVETSMPPPIVEASP
jgi:hypothetical protein